RDGRTVVRPGADGLVAQAKAWRRRRYREIPHFELGRSWSSDSVDPKPVLQYSLLDRSEELRPLIEAVDVHGAVFAWAVLNADLIHSGASLHTVRRGVPVGGMCNDFASHDSLGLHRRLFP